MPRRKEQATDVVAGHRRAIGVDLARGVAVMAMFVAYLAPAPSGSDVAGLCAFVATCLFAMLVGVGAELGWAARARSGYGRHLAAVLIRGAVLVVAGLLLEKLGAQLVVILAWLGTLTVLMALLVRLSNTVLIGVAALLFAVEPPLISWGRDLITGHRSDALFARLVETALCGSTYRLTALAVWATVGVLLTRLWLQRAHFSAVEPALGGVLAIAGAIALKSSYGGSFRAHDGSHLELVFDLLLSVGVLGLCLALGEIVRADVLHPLVACGQMAFTLYVVMVGVLAADANYLLHPGQTDDAWWLLAVLALGSIFLAETWQYVVKGAFQRGPLEGVVGLMTAPLGR